MDDPQQASLPPEPVQAPVSNPYADFSVWRIPLYAIAILWILGIFIGGEIGRFFKRCWQRLRP